MSLRNSLGINLVTSKVSGTKLMVMQRGKAEWQSFHESFPTAGTNKKEQAQSQQALRHLGSKLIFLGFVCFLAAGLVFSEIPDT